MKKNYIPDVMSEWDCKVLEMMKPHSCYECKHFTYDEVNPCFVEPVICAEKTVFNEYYDFWESDMKIPCASFEQYETCPVD